MKAKIYLGIAATFLAGLVVTQIPHHQNDQQGLGANPQTTITRAPPNPSTNTSATFKFRSTGSSFKCGLDGRSFKACVSPKTYIHLSLGQHIFQVASGGGVPASYTWAVSEGTVFPTPACDLTLNSGADLGAYENNSAYQGKVICLNDGSYTLTATQHTAGVKIYALHQYKAKVWGYIAAYGAGEEWHGVLFNNCAGFVTTPGVCSNPGGGGGVPQGMQVFNNNFVFVDGELTNAHTAGGWFLGLDGEGVAPINGLLIARNKIHDVGKLPGGTGADHPFYAYEVASGNITDNWLWNNIGFGIAFYPYPSNLHFDWNVVDREQEACAVFSSSGTGNTFEHNICAATTSDSVGGAHDSQPNAAGSFVGFNWFWNIPTPYNGNMTRLGGDGSGDPGFVDYANHNYNLAPGAVAAGYGPRVRVRP